MSSEPIKNYDHCLRNRTWHAVNVMRMMDKIRTIGGLPELPTTPRVPAPEHKLAQAKLILEEVLELFEACGIRLMNNSTGDIIDRTNAVVYNAYTGEIDMAEVAKELADVSVVTTGMFNEFGIADAPILEAVDKNNLEKFGPGGFLDDNRKWRKPPGHHKPDIASLLVQQGWRPIAEVADANVQKDT